MMNAHDISHWPSWPNVPEEPGPLQQSRHNPQGEGARSSAPQLHPKWAEAHFGLRRDVSGVGLTLGASRAPSSASCKCRRGFEHKTFPASLPGPISQHFPLCFRNQAAFLWHLTHPAVCYAFCGGARSSKLEGSRRPSRESRSAPLSYFIHFALLTGLGMPPG